jgi:hypothetical protein
LPPDERAGFTNPLWDHAASIDSVSILEGDIAVEADVEAPTATGSTQA